MTGVSVLHKPRGKRRAGYKTVHYNIPLVVYDGWRDIDTDSLVFRPVGGGMKESRYAMHDGRYFTDLLAAWLDGVIFADIPGRRDHP
jgi:hypothetical protein